MFTIQFSTSPAARKAAFLAGKTLPENTYIQIDPAQLTSEQRKLMAETEVPAPTKNRTYTLFSYSPDYLPDGDTLADVFVALEKLRDARAKDAARRAADQEKLQVVNKEICAAFLAGGEPTFEIQQGRAITDDADLNEKVRTEMKRRVEAELTAKKQKEAELAAAQQARVEALKNWTLEHGTDYLRDLINMGFNWQKESERFWFEMHTPEGWQDGERFLHYADHYRVDNPSPEGIEALKAEQKEHGAENVCLIRIKFNDSEKTWYEDYTSLTLTSPMGRSISVEKFAAYYTPKEKA